MTVNKNQKGTVPHIRLDILVCLFLVIITLAVYQQVRNYEFVNYDDDIYITSNLKVKSGLTAANIRWALTDEHGGNWHPVTWLSHMLDIELYGMNAGRHHLINVLFHIINTLLLFLVFRKMTGDLGQSSFVAALFALHPVQVESVAWVAERKNVLSTFFWMLTMWSYVRYIEHPEIKRYLLIVMIFVLGLMSKPMLVTLPFVLLLLDFWPLCRFENIAGNLQRNPQILRPVMEKIPLIVLAAVSCVVTLRVERVRSFDQFPLQSRIANALVSYTSYIKKMIWPGNLACIYPFPHLFPAWKVAGAVLLLVFISFLAFKYRKRHPYFLVGWLWYLGTLVPVIGLVQVGLQAMADRYAYVPFIGLFLIISWGVAEILAGEGYKSLFLSIFAVTILLALTVCTWFQISHWRNSIALFEHAVEVTDDNYIAYEKLGEALDEQHRFAEAIGHYKKSLQINPDFWPTHLVIGVTLREHGKLREALDHFYRVLSLKPDSVEAHLELGITLETQGSLAQAVTHYFEALRIKPDFLKAHIGLGNCMARQGNVKGAVYHYQEALRLDPTYAGAYLNLGKIYKGQKNIKAAILYYQKALQYSPNMVPALYNLALTYAGHEDEGFRNGRKALELAEELCRIVGYDQPFALDILAMAYAETGQFKRAVLTAQKALDLALTRSPEELVAGIQKRLQLFKRGQPYRQKID